ncbi:MAG: hypothetical protein IT184_13020 [Acidobacteria bacterium]|nr:hypothetical protein [Acidobacteriota bacterium]
MHDTSARRAMAGLECLRLTAIGRPLRVLRCRNLTPAGFDIETDAAVLLQMPMAFEFVHGGSSVILGARCVGCFEADGPQLAYVSRWVFLVENAESEAAIGELNARVHGVATAS